jgi:hypothetical protein
MAVCRGCGRPIVWGITADGGRIPLDPRPPVYIVTDWRKEGDAVDVRVVRSRTLRQLMEPGLLAKLSGPAPAGPAGHYSGIVALVSHFATCPKASEFSGGRKREGEKP